MIGIIPSSSRTFEVYGTFESTNLVEGKLYIDPGTSRVYFYSSNETRSNPTTGFFPVWDGKNKYISQFSNDKYLKDVIRTDVGLMCSNINESVAENIRNQHRRSDNSDVLRPQISDGDNMFTQCIKGILNKKEYTMIDLVDMSNPKLSEKVISNYYSALVKILFMRPDKWFIWLDIILHMNYNITVYKDEKKLLSYKHPENIFDTGIVKYDNIIKTKDDSFKKMIKILMIMENINKNTLRSEECDDYTINNMLTTLNGSKPISSQLFSRFTRMSGLNYEVHIYENETLVFEYRE